MRIDARAELDLVARYPFQAPDEKPGVVGMCKMQPYRFCVPKPLDISVFFHLSVGRTPCPLCHTKNMNEQLMSCHLIACCNGVSNSFEFYPLGRSDPQLLLQLANQSLFRLFAFLNVPAEDIPDIWIKCSFRGAESEQKAVSLDYEGRNKAMYHSRLSWINRFYKPQTNQKKYIRCVIGEP